MLNLTYFIIDVQTNKVVEPTGGYNYKVYEYEIESLFIY